MQSAAGTSQVTTWKVLCRHDCISSALASFNFCPWHILSHIAVLQACLASSSMRGQ